MANTRKRATKRKATARPTARRSLENPSTPLSDPDDWLYEALGAHRSTSGVRVSHRLALTIDWIWKGVNLIGNYMGKTPCVVYRRDGNGKERATEHPAYRLLRYRPGPSYGAFQFRRVAMSHILLRGYHCAYVMRSLDGRPLELLLLTPDAAYPIRANGEPWLVVEIGSETRRLPWRDVVYVPGLGYDGLVGYDVVSKMTETLGAEIAEREYGTRFFANSAEPRVVFEFPGKLTQDQRDAFRRSWDAMHAGLDNFHRTAVLEMGMKPHVLSIDAEKAQLIESRKLGPRRGANFFCLPPHKLGDDTRTAYASLEQENQSVLDDCMDPWFVAHEEEYREKLLTEAEKAADSHVVEFMREALVRADLAAQGDFYAKSLAGMPWMTRNEVRNKLNLNPMPGGDDLVAPINMQAAANASEDAHVAEDLSRALDRVLEDAKARVRRRLCVHVRKAAKTRSEFTGCLDALASEHAGAARDILGPVVDAVALARKQSGPALLAKVSTDVMAQVRHAAEQVYATTDEKEFRVAIDAAMTRLED